MLLFLFRFLFYDKNIAFRDNDVAVFQRWLLLKLVTVRGHTVFNIYLAPIPPWVDVMHTGHGLMATLRDKLNNTLIPLPGVVHYELAVNWAGRLADMGGMLIGSVW